ncbi:S-layer homology domain-containing protein [Paenibacillus sp. UMB4589-SE434]|uniref:S-layer homology domain-containing protein n=1 Tax=Paenibacillus sp. UMB4589-SE434 TaxID=3046314 RepID=UPI00254FE99B|nr:S-layer homology domain-containing protein [Paenibacillus sp. UMB4589-SE434]MDK8181605.1 S-layer homology domain-containing protein [Paenibacillus sp. UMB4589-SE434]
MRKYGWLLVCLVTVCGGISGAAAFAASDVTEVSKMPGKGHFKDVPDHHWASGAITIAAAKGYVSGYPDGGFRPNEKITRAEFIKMAAVALQLEVKAPTGEEWYVPYVEAAGGAKLTGETKWSAREWNQPMTRFEMASTAARAIGERTSDDGKWMYLAAKRGLITGKDQKGTLGVKDTTNRAQAVTIIERMLTVKSGGKLSADKYAVSSAELAWHGTNIFTIMPEIFTTPASQYAGKTIEELWRKDKMVIDSVDGKYRGQLDALVAIDLEDPHDPNLALLPDVRKLKWFNNDTSRNDLMVHKWRKSYILYYKGHEVYNKDTKMYAKEKYVPFLLRGFSSPDMEGYFNGVLNMPSGVYRERLGDIPAFIIPKKVGLQNGHLSIAIHTPAYSRSGYKSNELLTVEGPLSKPILKEVSGTK